MTMAQHRGSAARKAFAAAILGLLVGVSAAQAQSPVDGAASRKDADIDAFLANLQRTSTASASPSRPAASPGADTSARSTVTVAAREADTVGMQRAPAPTAMHPDEYRPAATLDDSSPFRTLLLMMGGIAICALATIGLTLTFFALRKDMKKKRRAHQRRFVPYPPKRGAAVAQS